MKPSVLAIAYIWRSAILTLTFLNYFKDIYGHKLLVTGNYLC